MVTALPISDIASSSPLISTGQAACFLLYAGSFLLWVLSEAQGVYDRYCKPKAHSKSTDEEVALNGVSIQATQEPATAASDRLWPTVSELLHNDLVKCLCLDSKALCTHRATLRNIVEFGSIMLWWYCVDRTDLLGSGVKETRLADLWMVFAVLTCVAMLTSIKQAKAPVLLNRTQTEEWKGWMQVLFLLYHYFQTYQLYNAIRVFIAAYVWMTGFGNFAYYYKTNDFSLPRFVGMMWRLNFLVTFACLVLKNSYMLYYICPMHTLYTLMVYAALAIGRNHNKKDWVIWLKMVLCVAVVYICWDIKPVFYAIWSPLLWLMGYEDPRRPTDDPLHEWYFRSSLDRYIWIFGMLCAFLHPMLERGIKAVEDLHSNTRLAIKAGVLAGVGVATAWWYIAIFSLPKLEYNVLHPYTSWIPIALFIVVRNFTPTLRLHAVTLYGWLGCITLETYIGQFHTWLKTEVPDGQPKLLLSLVPASFGINFIVCTALYVLVSYRLFHLTNDLKVAFVPHKCNRLLLRNSILLATTGVVFAAAGVLLARVANDVL